MAWLQATRRAPRNQPRAPTNAKLLFSKWSPADGTNAAFNSQDYGGPRWQLSDHVTSLAERLIRALAAGSDVVDDARSRHRSAIG
jgi:hypothetical protein